MQGLSVQILQLPMFRGKQEKTNSVGVIQTESSNRKIQFAIGINVLSLPQNPSGSALRFRRKCVNRRTDVERILQSRCTKLLLI